MKKLVVNVLTLALSLVITLSAEAKKSYRSYGFDFNAKLCTYKVQGGAKVQIVNGKIIITPYKTTKVVEKEYDGERDEEKEIVKTGVFLTISCKDGVVHHLAFQPVLVEGVRIVKKDNGTYRFPCPVTMRRCPKK